MRLLLAGSRLVEAVPARSIHIGEQSAPYDTYCPHGEADLMMIVFTLFEYPVPVADLPHPQHPHNDIGSGHRGNRGIRGDNRLPSRDPDSTCRKEYAS